ncbi:MAG: ABZJ_00895 family protein [Campylobacteraceae bacterium]
MKKYLVIYAASFITILALSILVFTFVDWQPKGSSGLSIAFQVLLTGIVAHFFSKDNNRKPTKQERIIYGIFTGIFTALMSIFAIFSLMIVGQISNDIFGTLVIFSIVFSFIFAFGNYFIFNSFVQSK